MINNPSTPLLSSSHSQSLSFSALNISRQNISSNSIRPSLNTLSSAPELNSISDIINEVKSHVIEKSSVLRSSIYTFTDIKLLSNQMFAFGVTDGGSCISVNLTDNLFDEISLSKNGLSGLLIFNSEKNALVKEKAFGKIYVLELPKMNILRVLTVGGEGNSGIGRMGLSPDESCMYARLWKGEIIRINLKTFEQDLSIPVKSGICMNISPEGCIVIGTVDRKLLVYSKDLEKTDEKTFDFKLDAFISFSQSGHLVLLAMQKEIKVINKANLRLMKSFDIGCQSYECVMTSDNSYIIAPLETGEIAFIELLHAGRVLKIQVHAGPVKSIFLISNEGQVLSFADDYKYGKTNFPVISKYKKIIDVNNGELVNKAFNKIKEDIIPMLTEPSEKNLRALCFCKNTNGDFICIGGQNKNIIVWNSKDDKKAGNLIGHEDYVYSLETIDDNTVASGSADCMIKIWDLRGLKFLCNLSGHNGTISCLARIDHPRLASGSEDQKVKIWLWQEKSVLFEIGSLKSPVSSFLSPRTEFLLIGLKESIQCWELKSYTMLFEKNCDSSSPVLKKLKVVEKGNKKNYIALGKKTDSFCFSDPFENQEIAVIGQDEYGEYSFLSYIHAIILYKVPQYEAENDKWMIFPYMVNSLHFYAYFDMPEYLYSAIINGSGLLPSVTGETPLTISIAHKNKDCIQSIIKAAWVIRSKNPFLLSHLETSSLLALNALNISCLRKMYNLLMSKYETESDFCPAEYSHPAIKASSEPIVPTKSIFDWSNDFENDLEITYKRSLISFYLELGSEKSIQFLESLCLFKQVKIFNTQTVKHVIKYKWSLAKMYLYLELLVFLCFYAGFLVFVFVDKLSWLLFICFGLSVLMFLQNVMITVNSFKIDYWAIFDCLRFVLFLVFFIINSLEIQAEAVKLSIIVCTSVQGFYYFKLFKKTRRLILVVVKTGQDIFSYVIILVYLLMALGAILHIVAIKDDLHAIDSLKLIKISEENFSIFIENLFLVFMSYINPIIMLNILLAISSSKYKASLAKAEGLKEVALSILRIEYLFIHKRDLNGLEFLQVCCESKKKKTGKIKEMNKLVKGLLNSQVESNKDLMKRLSHFDEKIKNIEDFIFDLKDSYYGGKRLK